MDEGVKGDELLEARREYTQFIQNSLQEEIELYKSAQDKVLKKMKVNENIWNQSMDAYLSIGNDYIINALKFTQSSPFTFHGTKTDDQVLQIFSEAAMFGLRLITEGTVSDAEAQQANFAKLILKEMEADDEQELLLVMDYLVIDLVRSKYGMGST